MVDRTKSLNLLWHVEAPSSQTLVGELQALGEVVVHRKAKGAGKKPDARASIERIFSAEKSNHGQASLLGVTEGTL